MPHFELLGLDLKIENGEVQGSTAGTMGPMLHGYLSLFLQGLNKNRVVATRNGGNVYTLYQPPVPSKAAVSDLTRKLMKKFTKAPYPSTCTLQTTNRCQASCIHCSAAFNMAQKNRRELTTEEFKDLIDQALALGVVNVTLSGGEPLLREDILELVAHVDPDRANCMMFTNGLLLDRAMSRDLKKAGIFSVMVSLDSPLEEEHDRMRRCPGLFRKAVEGIKNLLEEDVLVGISTYASHENMKNGRLIETMELGRELGIHELTVFDSVPTGEYLRHCGCILTPEEKDELRKLTEQWREDPDYPLCTTQAWINSPQGSGCFAANEQFYMTAWGDIGPCDFTPLSFGNVREDSLSAIWQRTLTHPAYCDAHQQCRMQDPEFRKQYIDTIPEGARLPIEVWKDPEAFKPPAEGDFKPSGKSKKTAFDLTLNKVGF